jgi:hypothetical protein
MYAMLYTCTMNTTTALCTAAAITRFTFGKTPSPTALRQRIVARNVYIPAGPSTLRVTFVTAGLNLRSITFNPTVAISIAQFGGTAAPAVLPKGQLLPARNFSVSAALAEPSDGKDVVIDAVTGTANWIGDGDALVLTLNVPYADTFEVSAACVCCTLQCKMLIRRVYCTAV